MKNIISILVLIIVVFSCKKSEDRACFKKEGQNNTKSIIVDHFEKIYLKENLDFILVQDTIEKVVINGGENLINLVEATIDDNTLSIVNNNKCNFLRYNAQKIKVYIHFKTLSSIHFEGTDSLNCQDTINVSWLTLVIRDGGGSVNLMLNADYINTTISNGYGDFKLSGTANAIKLFLQTNGYCDTYDLEVRDSISLVTYTPSICKIRANQTYLKGEIGGKGDVWCQGYPDSINVSETATGRLILKN